MSASRELLHAASLQQSKVQLQTYTGEDWVKLGDREEGLFAQVVDGAGPNLLGRDCLSAFELTLNGLVMHTSDLSQPLKGVLDKYAPVFKSDLGCLQGEKVHLFVDETVTPKFCKPRSVPLAMKESIETELDRLESTGIISPVKFAKWAPPSCLFQKRTVQHCGTLLLP